MHIQTILNRVHKFKGFVYGTAILPGDAARPALEVQIKPRAGSRAVCSGCGRPAPGYDTLPARRFEFIPFWGLLVYLVYAMRRVDCPRCGVKVERVPWAQGKSPICTAYAWYLAGWAKRLCWSGVAEAFHTSYHTVLCAVEQAVAWGREHMDRSGITAIEFVASDMWRAYLKVIAKKIPQAVHVLDRFHIVSHLNKALDQVRAEEAKQMKRKGLEPLLHKSRWCLLKRRPNLSEKQEGKLESLLPYNLRTVRTYLLNEQFGAFWEYVSPHWAGVFLDGWCRKVMYSKIEPLKKVARMLRGHRELILNWFRAKKEFSSGVVEGLNNKAKLSTKMAYGFGTFKGLEMALYHRLGDLPEPEVTHRFF